MNDELSIQNLSFNIQHYIVIHIIKIGGNVLNNAELLNQTLDLIAKSTEPVILVHGGGTIASELGLKLGIPKKMVDGRRITDDETIDLVTMVYGGLVNKKIVAQLQSKGKNALGITGADANILKAVKRPVKEIDFGWVGDVSEDEVNTEILDVWLEQGILPIMCGLTHDGMGHILNTNADTIASVIARAMSKKHKVMLHYVFELAGVLEDRTDESTLIAEITNDSFDDLVERKVIVDGMIPKLTNALDAVDYGVYKVTIGKAERLVDLMNQVPGAGTVIKD